jgi:hypothetical protein
MELSHHMTHAQQIEASLPCHRFDLSMTALVFAGLLAATALCAMESTPSQSAVQPVDEVLVVNDENVVGPTDIDPLALCEQNRNDRRCRDSAPKATILKASFSN